MKFRRTHKGQIIVLVALSVTVLLGFLGLATDVGVLWATKRKAQTAADARGIFSAGRDRSPLVGFGCGADEGPG